MATKYKTDSEAAFVLPEMVTASGVPRILQKSVAVIHSYAVNGEFSLLTRKVLNAIVALSQRQWSARPKEHRQNILEQNIVVVFQCRIQDIRALLEWKSNSHANDRIYAAIDRLQKLQLRFNTTHEAEIEFVEHASLIGQWGKSDEGLLTWQFMPDVLRMLVDPLRYASIDFQLSNAFSRGATLALYENTFRFNKIGRTAAWETLEFIRMLSSNDSYNPSRSKNAYSDFKRFILKEAMTELETSPACPFKLELHEIKAGRKVTHLQFTLHNKKQAALPLGAAPPVNESVVSELRALGVSEKTINEFLTKKDESELIRCLELTKSAQARGDIKRNIAGYFVELIRRGPVDEAEQVAREQLEEQKKKGIAQKDKRIEYEKEFKNYRIAQAKLSFSALSAESQYGLQEQFNNTEEARALRAGAKVVKGAPGDILERPFLNWYAEQPGALQQAPELNFETFLLKKLSAP